LISLLIQLSRCDKTYASYIYRTEVYKRTLLAKIYTGYSLTFAAENGRFSRFR